MRLVKVCKPITPCATARRS
jgi:magnesium chelatase family protein